MWKSFDTREEAAKYFKAHKNDKSSSTTKISISNAEAAVEKSELSNKQATTIQPSKEICSVQKSAQSKNITHFPVKTKRHAEAEMTVSLVYHPVIRKPARPPEPSFSNFLDSTPFSSEV